MSGRWDFSFGSGCFYGILVAYTFRLSCTALGFSLHGISLSLRDFCRSLVLIALVFFWPNSSLRLFCVWLFLGFKLSYSHFSFLVFSLPLWRTLMEISYHNGPLLTTIGYLFMIELEIIPGHLRPKDSSIILGSSSSPMKASRCSLNSDFLFCCDLQDSSQSINSIYKFKRL